eukprot:TRINITY_DN1041_c0_g2_i3.p1 TRINITY_DN1041_c0_g2~~TRINITY_DN1041_c0_g2_i3.p1  ORF type:complete len:617 (-),score=82.83 TRINITY_DN1041_c0_g2_i3:15355-17205(-)
MNRHRFSLFRFMTAYDSLLSNRLSNRVCASTTVFPQPQRYYLATREDVVPSLTKTILCERENAIEAPPVSIPETPPKGRKKRVIKPTDLYDALIYEGESPHRLKLWADSMAVTVDGSKISEKEDAGWRERLEQCRMQGNAEDALDIVAEISQKGYVLSARAAITVIEVCISSEEYEGAEHVLATLESLPQDHPTRTTRLVCIARTFLAMSFTSRGWYERALQVMQFPNQSFTNDDGRLACMLSDLGLGRDTLAWGVLMKALTKLGRAETAVAVVDIAMRQGVGMTDSLLHLTIDSLRGLNRWKEAQWLFDTAVEKGVKPSEMTLGSILLSLTSKDARAMVNKEKIKEIVDMAKHPSSKFMTTALMALTSVGLIERAESLFYEVGQTHSSGVPAEEAFGNLMAGYGNYLQLMPANMVDEVSTNGKLVEINKKADLLWELYMKHYRIPKIGSLSRAAKNMMIGNYLRVKTRSYKLKEAVDLLESLVVSPEIHPALIVRVGHICTVMGAIELSCDVEQLGRLTEIMRIGGIKHDIRSVAFAIGTHVGDGNLSAALALVENHLEEVSESGPLSPQFRQHHPLLLLRRLQTLRSALKDSGIRKLKDLDASISRFQRKYSVR